LPASRDRITRDCLGANGFTSHTDEGTLRVNSRKPETCETFTDAIERVDRNVFLVHTHCGGQTTTLVFQLIGEDTLRITNAENP
jgi:hypothetical protein